MSQKGHESQSMLGLGGPAEDFGFFTLSQEDSCGGILSSRICSCIQIFNEPEFRPNVVPSIGDTVVNVKQSLPSGTHSLLENLVPDAT